MAGRPAEALDLLAAEGAGRSDDLQLRGIHAVALARSGRSSSAEEQIRWFETLDGTFRRGSPWYWSAAIQANLGRKAEALRLLRESFDRGTGVSGRHADALLAPLWGYPAFETLIAPRG